MDDAISQETYHQESVMGARSSRQAAITTGRISCQTSLPFIYNHNRTPSRRGEDISFFSFLNNETCRFLFVFFFFLKFFLQRKRIDDFQNAIEISRRVTYTDPFRREIAARTDAHLGPPRRTRSAKPIFALFWLRFQRIRLRVINNNGGDTAICRHVWAIR